MELSITDLVVDCSMITFVDADGIETINKVSRYEIDVDCWLSVAVFSSFFRLVFSRRIWKSGF